MAPHRLTLAVNTPVIVLRNLNPEAGLCNGTHLLITSLHDNHIIGTALNGSHVGRLHAIPRVGMDSADIRLPFTMRRIQFYVRVAYAMTVSKSRKAKQHCVKWAYISRTPSSPTVSCTWH